MIADAVSIASVDGLPTRSGIPSLPYQDVQLDFGIECKHSVNILRQQVAFTSMFTPGHAGGSSGTKSAMSKAFEGVGAAL